MNSLVILLFAILILLFAHIVPAGDEPAPVVYMDPETGELRVQNPPKLSREHDINEPLVEEPANPTEQESMGRNIVLITGGILISFFVVLTGWTILKRKS